MCHSLFSDLDTVWLARLLKESHHAAKPVETLGTSITSAVPKGENYTSTVSRVKIHYLLASGSEKTFSMIVKTELTSEEARDTIADRPLFRSEITVKRTTNLNMCHFHMNTLLDF